MNKDDILPNGNEWQLLQKSIQLKSNIKILGLDYGEKKIGIATCSLNTMIALPYKVITRKSTKYDVEELKKIIDKFDIKIVVIGIPIFENQLTSICKKVINFAEILRLHFQLTLYFQDESFSSCMATEKLQDLDITRKKKDSIDDAVAASIILQNFLHTVIEKMPSANM